MTPPRYAGLAGKVLTAEHERLPGGPPSPDDRARAIGALEAAIGARARARRRLLWTTGVATFAAVAAGAVLAVGLSRRGFHAHGASSSPEAQAVAPAVPDSSRAAVRITGHPVAGDVSVFAGDTPAPLAEGADLAAGSRVVVPARGRALLAFSTGTSVLMDASSDLRVESAGATEALRLETGAVDLHVAKLHGDQRFLVHTPDTEVEVRGTQFRVVVNPADGSCGDRPTTKVTVTEGVVVVRNGGAETRVAAGEAWAGDCNVGPAANQGRGVGRDGPSASGSTLAAQNDLFSSALSAKRQGNARRAVATLDRFLAQYPGSPLTENATVERMRALRSIDASRAAAAAKDYLARYPHGFARSEAQELAEGP
jgi:hypothetical protein